MGTTNHVTIFKSHLLNYKSNNNMRNVLTMEGGRLQVNGIGNVFLSYGII